MGTMETMETMSSPVSILCSLPEQRLRTMQWPEQMDQLHDGSIRAGLSSIGTNSTLLALVQLKRSLDCMASRLQCHKEISLCWICLTTRGVTCALSARTQMTVGTEAACGVTPGMARGDFHSFGQRYR
eukprot:COSAG01_NODE_338_length_18671_cov_259.238154_7_plen_128_part_00